MVHRQSNYASLQLYESSELARPLNSELSRTATRAHGDIVVILQRKLSSTASRSENKGMYFKVKFDNTVPNSSDKHKLSWYGVTWE